MTNVQAMQMVELIMAYWTPERLALWKEYEKTDRALSFREYEKLHRKEETA